MATTLTNIQSRAQDLLELEDSNFLDDTQWLNIANDAQRELWSFILVRNPEVIATTANQSITATTTNYWALGTSHRRTLAVEVDPDTSSRRFLDWTPLLNKNHRHPFGRRMYRIDKTNLYIEPIEASVGSYRHYYVGIPTEFTSGASTVDAVIDPWAREWCAIRAAMKGAVRDDGPYAELKDRMMELRREVASDVMAVQGALPRKMLRTKRESADWMDR